MPMSVRAMPDLRPWVGGSGRSRSRPLGGSGGSERPDAAAGADYANPVSYAITTKSHDPVTPWLYPEE